MVDISTYILNVHVGNTVRMSVAVTLRGALADKNRQSKSFNLFVKSMPLDREDNLIFYGECAI